MTVDHTLTSVFVDEGVITAKELDSALTMRSDVAEDIGEFLVRVGMITEHDRVRCVGIQNGVQFVQLSEVEIDPAIAKTITHSMALRYKAIPVGRSGDLLKVAMANPLDVQAIDDIARATNLEPLAMIALEEEILEAVFQCFGAAVTSPTLSSRQ